jgi:nucleoside-diphosphate-sugar epimerase
MINGIRKNRYFNIDEGRAHKSIVMAEDVASCIPAVAPIGGTYNLTDGYHPSFAELAALIANQLDKNPPPNISRWLALPLAFAGNYLGNKAPLNTDKLRKITASLTFDDKKARTVFGWNPMRVLDHFIIN